MQLCVGQAECKTISTVWPDLKLNFKQSPWIRKREHMLQLYSSFASPAATAFGGDTGMQSRLPSKWQSTFQTPPQTIRSHIVWGAPPEQWRCYAWTSAESNYFVMTACKYSLRAIGKHMVTHAIHAILTMVFAIVACFCCIMRPFSLSKPQTPEHQVEFNSQLQKLFDLDSCKEASNTT